MYQMNNNTKPGSELKPGDVIEVFGERVTIAEIRPYVGTLFNNGTEAVIAEFTTRKTGMTIEKDNFYRIYN